MQITLTKKELLVLLDVLIFVHTKFHREEFSALTGHQDETRIDLRKKVIEALVDLFSANNHEIKISFSKSDKDNIEAAFNNFMLLSDYEQEGRFVSKDVLDLETKFN